ncbi:alpha/beta hydrolase family protein [Microbulbifer sp. JMSA003]|uniref:alpha/beta hydrolase family protein n=1 Tax=Microbulbifer sp. JMSA003 TaxID=3243369 RepID=UPI00403A6C89
MTISDHTSVKKQGPFVIHHAVLLPDSVRGQELKVRVIAPVNGENLPIVIFAHGYKSPPYGYAPITEFLASLGFVVLQPVFLDSEVPDDDPRVPEIWQYRVSDMKRVLDELDSIEKAVSMLRGRLDKEKVVAIGHSYGAQTVGMLLGARVLNEDNIPGPDLSDKRVRAGVLLCATGTGGENLSPFAAKFFPFMNPSFTEMTAPCLVVAADQDDSPLSTRGPDWFTDAFTLGTGAEYLLTLVGAKHLLGGINGYGVINEEENNPAHVSIVQAAISAYLSKQFYEKNSDWEALLRMLKSQDPSIGFVEEKSANNFMGL